jgi:S-disulfanyl-L-cysteine oxidoreductase SoxD
MLECVAVLLLAGAAPAQPLGIGRPATPDEVRSRDATILPSGSGLPLGHGTAREGRPIYELRCASCHGPRGEGQGDHPPLAGGRGSLASENPVLTVGSYWPYATTVWDYIRRAMPYEHPSTLSPDQIYAVTAFVLYLNGIVGEDDVLDQTTLPQVRMPNRDGFVSDPRDDSRAADRRPRTPHRQ